MKKTNGGMFDHLFKILLIGDSGVGKSCILLRFSEDSFTSSFITTIGIDFKIRTVEIDGKRVKLQIWDTAGQERFRNITTAYYRGAHGIMLVYDISDDNSFANIRSWMRNIDTFGNPEVIRMLIGNKCDVFPENRKITFERGQALAQEFEINFLETSAKANINIDKAFQTLTGDILKDRLSKQLISSASSNITLTSSNSNSKSWCSC